MQIGWKGYSQIAYHEHGIIIEAFTVHSCDEYHIEQGLNSILKHVPNYESQTDQNLIGAYSIAIFPDGRKTWVYMDLKKILKRKQVSAAKDSDYSPWKKWFAEMCMKTVVRNHVNRLPKGHKSERMGWAIHHDNGGTDIEEANVIVEEEKAIPAE